MLKDVKELAKNNCSKVVSHHPDSEDVFIFHFGIELASCAKPQCFDDQIAAAAIVAAIVSCGVFCYF